MFESSDSVRAYLQSIGKYPLLSAVEEIELGRQVQTMLNPPAGVKEEELKAIVYLGEKAKQKMITCNLRLVVKIAIRYQGRGLEFLDLIQEGALGLGRAVEKFDPSLGYKFSTYAHWWILQSITRALQQKSRPIKMATYIWEKLNSYKKAQRELSQQLKRSPTVDEIAEYLEISTLKLLKYLQIERTTAIISLEQFVGDPNIELSSTSADSYEKISTESLQKALASELANINPKYREILILRYGLQDGKEKTKTLNEIARVMELSRERIRQLEKKAFKLLRQSKVLQSFL